MSGFSPLFWGDFVCVLLRMHRMSVNINVTRIYVDTTKNRILHRETTALKEIEFLRFPVGDCFLNTRIICVGLVALGFSSTK